MDWSDRVAFMVVFSMGAFLTSVPLINWSHKDTVVGILGGLMVLFCLWAVVSDVTKRYKIVEVN